MTDSSYGGREEYVIGCSRHNACLHLLKGAARSAVDGDEPLRTAGSAALLSEVALPR